MFSKYLKSRWCLIAVYLPFLVVSTGGSGLHHAPIFGLHGCCHDHAEATHHHANHCCNHHHESVNPPENTGDHEAGELSSPCSICNFFANAHASFGESQPELEQPVSILVSGIMAKGTLHFATGFLARGPPIS